MKKLFFMISLMSIGLSNFAQNGFNKKMYREITPVGPQFNLEIPHFSDSTIYEINFVIKENWWNRNKKSIIVDSIFTIIMTTFVVAILLSLSQDPYKSMC